MKAVWDDFEEYTHIIFTSKNTIPFFLEAMRYFSIPFEKVLRKKVFAVGKVTAQFLEKEGVIAARVAEEETQEGVIALLAGLEEPYVFCPRSSQARKQIEQFLITRTMRHQVCDLYDPIINKNFIPSLDDFDEIVFTSPSTVKSFSKFFSSIPSGIQITCMGSITQEAFRFVFGK